MEVKFSAFCNKIRLGWPREEPQREKELKSSLDAVVPGATALANVENG